MKDRKKFALTVTLPVVTGLLVAGSLLFFLLKAPAGAPPLMVISHSPDCDFDSFIGKPVDDAALQALGRPFRVLPPGAAATMDHAPERLNLHTDENGVVLHVSCG